MSISPERRSPTWFKFSEITEFFFQDLALIIQEIPPSGIALAKILLKMKVTLKTAILLHSLKLVLTATLFCSRNGQDIIVTNLVDSDSWWSSRNAQQRVLSHDYLLCCALDSRSDHTVCHRNSVADSEAVHQLEVT